MWCMWWAFVSALVACPLVQVARLSGFVLTFWGCPRFRGAFPSSHRGIFPAGTGRNVAKVRFYLLALVFSREFGIPKGAKPKYIFEIWCRCGVGSALFVCLSSCPLVQGAGLVHSFRAVFPPFCQLSCFACDTLRLNMALFRVLRAFLARFGVFV